MRRNVLLRSVQRLLPDGVTLHDAVFMWRRAPWMVGAVVVAVAVALAATTLAGYGSAGGRIMLSLAIGMIVAVLGTENRVLASTDRGLQLFRASRIRQVAVELLQPLDPDVSIEMVSSNLVLTDWSVDGDRFTVPKRSQEAMTAMAATGGVGRG
ncbi:MAG: hypothetical protein AAFP84_06385 [Actinomycetota bacterium]